MLLIRCKAFRSFIPMVVRYNWGLWLYHYDRLYYDVAPPFQASGRAESVGYNQTQSRAKPERAAR